MDVPLVGRDTELGDFLEHLPDALVMLDDQGTILDANPAASLLFATPHEDLVGRSARDLAVDAEALESAVANVLTALGHATVTFLGRRPEGTVSLSATVFPVRLGDRPVACVLARDLTDQARLQSELLRAQKMEALGQLVSGVAHELNNPLSAIIAFSRFLQTDQRLPPDMRHDADLLVREAERTRRIVQNLLDFARQRPPSRQPIDIHDLVRRTVELQAYQIGAGKVHVVVDLPDDLPLVDVDPNQVQLVLLNLTLNALQSMRGASRGQLTIGARGVAGATAGEPGLMRITVADDGPGVPDSVRPHLFEPFFTTKDVGEGTGLGLPVSYGIVVAHGGRLWFEPTGGGGATFIVELPAAPAFAAAVSHAAPPVTGAPLHASILVVDDEPSMRALLTRAFQSAGHEVATAADGPAALRHLGAAMVDVLILDHRMPGMDGVETYRRALELRPELARRTLMMSGDVLHPALHAFARAHDLPLLAKPFDLADGLAAVEAILRRAA
jgi:two-component system NtrC family sensor kinase